MLGGGSLGKANGRRRVIAALPSDGDLTALHDSVLFYSKYNLTIWSSTIAKRLGWQICFLRIFSDLLTNGTCVLERAGWGGCLSKVGSSCRVSGALPSDGRGGSYFTGGERSHKLIGSAGNGRARVTVGASVASTTSDRRTTNLAAVVKIIIFVKLVGSADNGRARVLVRASVASTTCDRRTIKQVTAVLDSSHPLRAVVRGRATTDCNQSNCKKTSKDHL